MAKDITSTAFEERVLVSIADDDDASLVSSILAGESLSVERIAEPDQIWTEAKRGALFVILDERVIVADNLVAWGDFLKEESPWSDLPTIVLGSDGDTSFWDHLASFNQAVPDANVLFMESPLREVVLANNIRIALRARRRQYQTRDLIEQREAILGSIRDPFILLDRDLRFVYLNDRAAEMRQKPRRELVGRVKSEVVPQMIGTSYHKALLVSLETGEPQCEEHIDPSTGRCYEMRIYPSRTGVAVFGSDITDRKEAEEALRQSEERLRLMVESAVEYAIFSMDCHGLVTSWNRGAERILGYSEEEILGRPMEILYSPDDQEEKVPAQERERARTLGQAEDERWHVRKDGTRFWASGQSMSMVDSNGDVRGYVKILRDYTGRKRAETWLMALNETLEKRVAERTAEAEDRARQLQMLAAELTEAEERERRRLAELLHDHLQQLLVAAKMQIGILSQRSSDEAVTGSLSQVDNLLQQSIDASRSLTVELSPPILYDAGLGAAFHWLARRMLENHGLNVTIEAQEEAEPESENLRAFLFQAVRELLFNVVKHAAVKEARLELSRLNGDVRATVSDCGVGFDVIERQSLTKSRGFGLFSMGERVALLQGSIDIRSAIGRGTTVSVTVPIDQPEREGSGRPPAVAAVRETESEATGRVAAKRSSGLIRILIADDHKILREGLAGLLREQPDFEVVSEASDGQFAVEMARETKPDVIIMDVSMPRLNGIEATRIIKGEMPEIRIIGLSMHAEEDLSDAMRQAGAIAYMTKGVPSEILTAAIRDAAAAKA